MTDPIRIGCIEDFHALADQKLATIVDPIVFRTGELFLRGRRGLNQRQPFPPLSEDDAWDFLLKNIEGLGFFFDALVLNDRLPLINYSDTFDVGANIDDGAFSALNEVAKRAVLVPVEVERETYLTIKRKAVQTLQQHRERSCSGPGVEPRFDRDLAGSIAMELSQCGYRWHPGSPEIEATLDTDQDRALFRFLLAGMIFGQYADLMGSEHWLQPKRSRLFVQATIAPTASKSEDEQALFERLGTQYKLPFGRTWQPTFMHHILMRAETRRDIPRIVMRLRDSGAVRDYRAWREKAIAEWQSRGGISKGTAAMMASVRTLLSGEDITQDVQNASVAWVGTAAAVAAAGPASTVASGVATAVIKSAPPAWNFVQGLWPGRRHIKLLAESIQIRQRYPHIERCIRTLWSN